MKEIKWTYSHHEKGGDIFTGWIKNLLVVKKANTFSEVFGIGPKPLFYMDYKTFNKMVLK